jgi:hypothetical protein
MLGAAVAIRSAIAATRAVRAAEQVRDDIASRSTLGDLAELYALERQALNAMSKYGPGSSARSAAGADSNRDAADVRAYLEYLKRQRNAFGTRSPHPVDSLCLRVYDLLNKFGAAGSDGDRQANGGLIYVELSSFSYRLKQKLERHRLQAAAV